MCVLTAWQRRETLANVALTPNHALALACCAALGLLGTGCGGKQPPSGRCPDCGSGAGDAGGGGGDAGGGGPGTVAVIAPSLPALETVASSCVAGLSQPRAPSLFVDRDRVLLFFNAQDPANVIWSRAYLQSTAAGSSDFAPAVEVYPSGRGVDLIRDDTALWGIIGGGAGQSHLIRSDDDGVTWQQQESFSAGSATCVNQAPAYFLRPSAGDPVRIALGYDNDDGIFGCSHQLLFAERGANGWAVSTALANGTPSGAFVAHGNVVLATHGTVVISEDDGATFSPHAKGDTTAELVRGTSLAMDEEMTLYLAQSYTYAGTSTLAVLLSRDGLSFEERWILPGVDGANFADPQIAVSGASVVVAWRGGAAGNVLGTWFKYGVWVMFSPDRGGTWSEPVQVDAAGADENIASLALAVAAGRILLAFDITGEDIGNDARSLCVVDVAPGN